jgi:putative inorganic carbon (hco3(-)) transporter
MERLVFGYGTSRHKGETPETFRPQAEAARVGSPTAANSPVASATNPLVASAFRRKARSDAAPRDWAFLGLMAFTALLFLRPQDIFPALRVLHLAEVSALFALGSLAAGRLRRGLTVTRLTPELIGVFAFAFLILAAAPFSVWMGGAVSTFTELYAKVVLIFVLMVNALTSPKRMEQFTWVLVIASGYIGGRAVLDYARGINLIEHGRVQGSVGGMFKNPNDLALNMVAVLPLAAFLMLRPLAPVKRATAALCAFLMVGAVVASQSRSGTLGLAVMGLVFAGHMLKRQPGLVFGLAIAGALALPLLPSSYWQRVASITDNELDQTGSREARSILLKESFDAFAAHPLTGVGAGNFKIYNPEERQEAWRESHNVILQVAAELGIGGLMIFGFLLVRAAYAPVQTRRLLRAARPGSRPARHDTSTPPLDPAEHDLLTLHAAALSAALAGWFVCALFASVAYHWTFYYLLALATAPREYLLARVATARAERRAAASRTIAAAGAHA